MSTQNSVVYDNKRVGDKNSPSSQYPIGRWELTVYYTVWAIHTLVAAAVAVQLALSSNGAGRWVEYLMTPSRYLNGYKMDDSDLEWQLFRATAAQTVAAYSIHSIVFRLVTRYLNLQLSSVLLIIFWTALHLCLTSFKCILFIGVLAFVTTALVAVTRRESIAWLVCGAFMLNVNRWAPFSAPAHIYYREFNLYLYTSVRIINYCIYLARRKPREEPFKWRDVIDYVEYLCYPMYSTALIVLYADFRAQITSARASIRSTAPDALPSIKTTIWQAVRLTFWFAFFECCLHFWRVNAFFNSPFTFLHVLHDYELVVVSYLVGQLFHVKYVIIFGLPRLFTEVDGLAPPPAPICISRVSKYSQMWRHFDRGLYNFLKEQVYIPLIGDSSADQDCRLWTSIGRKILATVTVFAFVLGWHGVSSNYLYWVLLSGIELSIERFGQLISRRPITIKIKERFGMTMWTRLTALGMLGTVVPGIFGVFFFLGQVGVGDTIFRRVLLNGTWNIVTLNIHYANSGWVMLHLYLIGYCFNHVCFHLETVDRRQRTVDKQKTQ